MDFKIGTKVIVNGHSAGTITRLFETGGFEYDEFDSGARRIRAHPGLDTVRTTGRGVTEDELQLLKHISMFGSTGYPVRKLGPKWTWDYRSIKGPPVLFKTKREAVGSFEAFLDVLRDAYAGRL